MTGPAPDRVTSRATRRTFGSTRLRFPRLVTGLVIGLAGGLVAAAPAVGTEDPPGDPDEGISRESARGKATPLRVSIDSLSPSSLPRRGEVTVTGTITNRSESAWRDLNVYLFVSATPMTHAEELAEATATEATLEVGARLTEEGRYDEVPDLAPGESTSYRLSVPRRAIPAEDEGVYWLGVHVLGADEDGRVDGADGRARTFIPLMRSDEPRTSVSLVVPVKAPVARRRDGGLAHPRRWGRLLGGDGRLDRLLGLSRTTSGVPLTLLVDPAVLEAVRSVAEGNPSFDTSPTDARSSDANPSPEDPETEAAPDEEADPDLTADELTAEARRASDWLAEFLHQANGHSLLRTPYADLDLAAVLRADAVGLYEQATELGAATLDSFGLSGDQVLTPVDGSLPTAALPLLGPSTILLSQDTVDTDRTVVQTPDGHRLVRTSAAAQIGGPAPTRPFDALALRQRILGEAAVHALTGAPGQPLVVQTPDQWNPGEEWRSSGFFFGLDTPWLRLVDLPTALASTGPTAYDGRLRYPRAHRRQELPAANVLAGEDLQAAGSVLAGLLNRNDTIDDQVARAAMLSSSRHARQHPHRAVLRTRRITDAVRGQLEQVRVESSPLVTMSSETGNFSVTVVNDLEEPVTVGIQVETGTADLDIRSPDLVSLGPGQRASVRLAATATDTGVHSVSIFPTTRDGRPLGGSTTIKVRSSQVGMVIWLIIGTGGVVFVGAIALRILRRLRDRRSRSTPSPPTDATT